MDFAFYLFICIFDGSNSEFMRKNLFVWFAWVCLFGLCGCKEDASGVRYVFYFIGDGMGMNQVNGTEMFLAELDSVIGIKPLNFTGFPVRNYATTYSAFNGVTCSAAAGTALATGVKTRNYTIGMDREREHAVYSVARKAKDAGRRVGILTSVGMNHATPAAFYAHQPKRTMYFEIGKDAIAAGFDLYGGGDIIQATSAGDSLDLYRMFERAGYTITRGCDMFREHAGSASKMVMLQEGGKSTLPYAIDRTGDDLTLARMTSGAIDYLNREGEGFFLMVEGGLIDYACHVNDAATVFRETEDFAGAVQVAMDFYAKHPDETLIVVTADHETGGIVLGNGSYELNLKILGHQKVSLERLTLKIKDLRREKNHKVSWEDVRGVLSENLGFWQDVELSGKDEQRLKTCFEETFSGKDVEMVKNLYSEDEPIAKLGVSILNDMAKVKWVSGGHSAGVVPVYAAGAGASRFGGRLDNTDIPGIVAELGGY